MRFCPKCSLKIKAHIDRCPICKVELLSCAEDEEAIKPLSQEDPRAPAPPEARQPDSVQGITPPSEDLTVLTRKLKSIEDHLLHIEKTIELDAGRDEVIKSSIVDLECKINKVEKTISALESSSQNRLKKLEADVALLCADNTAPLEEADSSGRAGTPLETSPEPAPPAPELAPPRDFPIRGRDFSEEEMSFADTLEGDFEGTFSSPPADEVSPRKRRRRLTTVLLPLTALLLVIAWLVYYYAAPRTQDLKEALLIEDTVLPSLPTDTVVQPGTGSTETAADGGVPAESSQPVPAPRSPEPLPALSPPETPPAPPPDSARSGGYTVNVGAFNDKELALKLTTRLREKGYAAIMSPSQDKRFYRVKVGAFSTKKEARDYASVLEKKEKLPTFVARINEH